MQRGSIILAFPLHIRALCKKQFDNFLAAVYDRGKQGSPRFASLDILHIDIRTRFQALVDGFDVP